MNKRICILLVLVGIMNTTYSFAQDDNNVIETSKQNKVGILQTIKNKCSKQTRAVEINLAAVEPVEVAAIELEKIEVKNIEPAEVLSIGLNPVEPGTIENKKNNKIRFLIFKKMNKSKNQEPVFEESKAETAQPVEDNSKDNAAVNKPIEKIVDVDKKSSKKGQNEIIINNATMQGTVASDKIISLDDCVKLALENHPAIKSAVSSADIYKTKIGQAWSAYFPVLTLDANFSKNDMLITNFSFPSQEYDMYNTPKIGANWMLFDFGKTKVTADIHKKAFESAQSGIQLNINDVIFNVKKAYYNLLFALQQEEVYSKTVGDFELHLKQAKAYYEIGTKPKIDVMTAEYNLGKAKLNYIKAKNNVTLAYAQVSSAMGLPEFNGYNISEKLDSWAYKVDFDKVLETAYETRPELISAKKKAEGSELLIRASKRAYMPNVAAFGNYTQGGKNPTTDHGYQIGAGLTYSSLNLMLLKKQVDESKATYQRDAAEYEKAKQSVYLDVKRAYIDLYNAQDSIPVSKLSMGQAKEQYDLASGRYKVGLGDAIELKDAENTYRNAQLDYYSTLLDYNVSAANIERVIGSPIEHTDTSLL